jgi:hypothetical protein
MESFVLQVLSLSFILTFLNCDFLRISSTLTKNGELKILFDKFSRRTNLPVLLFSTQAIMGEAEGVTSILSYSGNVIGAYQTENCAFKNI